MDDTTDEGHLFKTISYAIAGYERKKIVQRANNGRLSRMKNGFWPFASPPLGYIRERLSARDYVDKIDPIK